MARAVERRNVQPVANVQRGKLEGWIHLPQHNSLERLR